MNTLLIRITDVAKALNVCTLTVRKLIAAKQLPAVRVGRAVRVPVSALEAFVGQHTTAGASSGGGTLQP